jgi:enoyl-CoA hydratase/carnithine racemase
MPNGRRIDPAQGSRGVPFASSRVDRHAFAHHFGEFSMNDALNPAAVIPYVLRSDAGAVATLTMNRPDSINALSSAMIDALQVEFDRIAADASVRIVVIAAAGKHFCAGHDLKEMRAEPSQAYYEALFAQCARVLTGIVRLPQPVIARVHGVATAAGCQLVAQCDLAVAADVARFALPGVNIGLFCSTPAVALGRNVPRKFAMEMLLTGDMIDAPTALARGLVNRVVPVAELDATVAALADKIKAKSAVAIRLGKQTFYRQIEQGIGGAYAQAGETLTCNVLTEDAAEGMSAFTAKRPPHWPNR